MKSELVTLSRKVAPGSPPAKLTADYLARLRRFCPAEESFTSFEESLLSLRAGGVGRLVAQLILFDSRGELFTSEEFAERIRRLRDGGTQRVVFAIGPPDGWSKAALDRADAVLSLGRMTLPHELARVIVAEQVYRAFTILAGHPYHLGH